MSPLRNIFFNEITLGSDKWDPYFDVYEMYFSKFINRAPVLVEVGVQSGGSIQMWRKFLGPEAKIYGIDIDSSIMNHKPFYDENTFLYVGDQESPEFWDNFLKDVPNIDIFIDDGGHYMNQQIVTFEKVFPHMNEGGVFLCEDTHTSYMPWCGGSLYKGDTFTEYSKRLIDIINYQHVDKKDVIDQRIKGVCEGLRSIHFHDSIVVMLKEKVQEFKRQIVNK